MIKTKSSAIDGKGVSFDEKMKLLIAFRKAHKRFPGTKENKMLYLFMSELRGKKKFNMLSTATCNKLNKIHFEWDKWGATWNRQYDIADRMMNGKNGSQEIWDDVKLRSWVNRNIALYFKGELADEKKKRFKMLLKKLEINVGKELFIFEKIKLAQAFSSQWMIHYNEIKDYLAKHKRFPPVRTTAYNWCNTQKYKFSKLPIDKKKLLNDIDFLDFFDRWNLLYEKIMLFVKKHKRLPEMDGQPSMYAWLTRQNKMWLQGKLSEKQITRLKKLGLSEPLSREEQWETKFIKLQAFRKKYPTRWPSAKIEKEYMLAIWIQQERNKAKKFRQGKLKAYSEKQIKKLNSIGFHWNRMERKDEIWMLRLKRMLQLTKRTKGGRFSWKKEEDTYLIKIWYNMNVTYLNKGILSVDRINLLKKAKIILTD